MSLTQGSRLFVLLSFCVGAMLALAGVASADTCADGSQSHIATAQEAASSPNGAIVAGKTQVCPGDAKLGISGDVGAAKQYLKSLPRSGSATDDGNIDRVNDTFAVCAANFFKEYQKRYGSINITSAYRSPAYDAKMCVNNPRCGNLMNNPNPQGNHQRGMAIDVKASGDQRTLWDFAQQNPQFGVCFPFTSGGFIDTVHMILVGGPGNEASGPGCRGVTKACSGAPPLNVTTPSASPSAGLADAVRGLFNQQMNTSACVTNINPIVVAPPGTVPASQCIGQPPSLAQTTAPVGTPSATPASTPATTPSTQSPASNQPQVCDPKLSCSSGVTYYQTSSCTTQVYQVCQYGCAGSGTSCATSTSTSATSTNNNLTGTSTDIGSGVDSTNNNTNDNTDSSGPSVSDLLNNIANSVSFSATDVGTSTSLAFRLNPDTGDVETLGPPQSTTTAIAAGTITSIQPAGGQQTFTSGDIGSTFNAQYLPQQVSLYQSILNSMQSALLWALNALKPFGGSVPGAVQPGIPYGEY